MPPLALMIYRELCKPVAQRRLPVDDGWRAAFDEAHYFCVNGIKPLAHEMYEVGYENSSGVAKRWGWLPFPTVWLEWVDGKSRVAILIRASKQGDPFSVLGQLWLVGNADGGFNVKRHDYVNCGCVLELPKGVDHSMWEAEKYLTAVIRSSFQYINKPQNVGLTVRQPHAGLARKLAKAHGMVGKFPLRAWTEVRLDGRTRDHGGKVIEGGHSLRRCQHWVRTHIRPSTGALIMAHVRGDPSLGMKRSRYVCSPGAMA